MTNWTTFCKRAVVLLGLLGLISCASRQTAPGVGVLRSTSGLIAGLQQSESPKNDSTQTYKRTTEDANGNKTSEEVATKIGAAQKDVARETAAKLSALRPTIYVGILVFLFGAASLFWPPLKLLVGSITTSAAIAAGGLVLIVLPSLVVGNELLIFGGVALAVSVWFLAHRHGKARGELETLKR